MSFEHAPVTKGLMMASGLTSLLGGIFDVKHYLHLQLVPHISRHHQYWRLFAHHLAFASSSDLFIAELVLYNVGVQVERMFGSAKFASFAVVSTLLSTTLEFSFLLLFHRFGLNYIPPGPSALVFNILYQYSRIVPHAYDFRIFGIPLTNKIFVYILASQLALGHLPGSAATAIIGLIAGQIYRSDLAGFNAWRLPPRFVRLAARILLPLIGSTRPQRRTNQARPDRPDEDVDDDGRVQNDEVITTARPAASTTSTVRGRSTAGAGAGTAASASTQSGRPAGSSVVREWVDELTGRADRANTAPRVPTNSEITALVSMFPNLDRQVIVAALQQSPTVEGAVETLLSS